MRLDPVRPALEEEEDSSGIWRNLERCWRGGRMWSYEIWGYKDTL
jgi:hypothetical protein